MEVQNKKYRLLPEASKSGLHRIQAVKDFSNIKKGDLGGWVDSEDNLSHKGNCWIYGNAQVKLGVRISENAMVCDNAILSGYGVSVKGNAVISDIAMITGDFLYSNYTQCSSKDRIEIVVDGNAKISGKVFIAGEDGAKVHIGGNAHLYSEMDKHHVALQGDMELLEDREYKAETMPNRFNWC